MGLLDATVRGGAKVVNASTTAAGAVSGAVISGVVGGLRGTVDGMRSGVSNGSRSTPAAALTLAALGAAGLVEWPVVLVAGGAALAVRRFTRPDEQTHLDGGLRSMPTPSTTSASRTRATRSTTTDSERTAPQPAKSPRAVKSTPKAAKSAARKVAQPRRSRPTS